MLSWLRTAFKSTGRVSRQPDLSLTDDGFRLVFDRGETLAIAWADVAEIATFKRDLYIYDDIRLSFRRRGTDLWLEISEECAGFPEMAAEMRRRFPTIDEAWYLDVMQPPFATNYTLLYGPIDNSHPA